MGQKREHSLRNMTAKTTNLLITILRRRVTSLYMRGCGFEGCVQCAKSGGAHLVFERGLLRVIRVLCGDRRNESEAQ